VICDKLLIIYKVKQLVKSLSLFQVIVDAVGFIVIRKGVFLIIMGVYEIVIVLDFKSLNGGIEF
jgi:hypothetical protein